MLPANFFLHIGLRSFLFLLQDLSGRPHLSYDLNIPTQRVGTYDTQVIRTFTLNMVVPPLQISCCMSGILSHLGLDFVFGILSIFYSHSLIVLELSV